MQQKVEEHVDKTQAKGPRWILSLSDKCFHDPSIVDGADQSALVWPHVAERTSLPTSDLTVLPFRDVKETHAAYVEETEELLGVAWATAAEARREHGPSS